MKRSEMITVLLDAINENQYQDYYWLPHEAERVLSILEKAGMLPPSYIVDNQDKTFGHYEIKINEWEPEDE